jgi:uncharacterized protein (TIGR03435 family)
MPFRTEVPELQSDHSSASQNRVGRLTMRCIVCTAIVFLCTNLVCTNLGAQTPPARPQFEVASVKPGANRESGDGRIATLRLKEMLRSARPPGMIPRDDPGRIRLEDWALLDLIAAAYSVRATQVSGPGWLADQVFNIEAKVPADTRKEELNAMLQSLLEERFGLKVHRDTKTTQGFALTVGKNGPKLKPAEQLPSSAPEISPEDREKQAQARMAAMQKRMQENRESGTPLVGLSRSNFSSVTTEQLAVQVARMAEAPVADETHLTGKYAVTIETWKNADVPGGTIFDAVEKLGLRLEPRKVTVETVVVDQVSKTPTAN